MVCSMRLAFKPFFKAIYIYIYIFIHILEGSPVEQVTIKAMNRVEFTAGVDDGRILAKYGCQNNTPFTT